MKTKTKLIIALACAFSATLPLALAACAKEDSTVADLVARGYNVIVDFENGGGYFAGAAETTVRDFYRYEDLQNGIRIQNPESNERGSAASSITYSGHFLIGWYSHREARVDENGAALDEYGDLCSVSGLEQGYTYANPWSFEESRLTLDSPDLVTNEKIGGKEVYHLTLYPAWSPNFEYALYREGVNERGEKEWVKYQSVSKPSDADSVPVPRWSEEKGAIDYGAFSAYYVAPQSAQYDRDGNLISPEVKEQFFSLTGIYADPALAEPYADGNLDTVYAESIPHIGTTDYRTGTSSNIVVALYTTWREGLWYRSTSAENFAAAISESRGAGNFEIMNDLDFMGQDGSATSWSGGSMTFSGTIDGKGNSIKNLSSSQTDQTVMGGVFGAIADGASLKNVSFEGVDFLLQNATARFDGYYGLLAGTVSARATLTDVSVGGTIRLGKLAEVGNPPYANFTIGLVAGNAVGNAAVAGISAAGIGVTVEKVWVGYDSYFNDVLGWPVRAQINENGTVTVTKNEDPQIDPNEN